MAQRIPEARRLKSPMVNYIFRRSVSGVVSRASNFEYDYDPDSETLFVDTGGAQYRFYGVPEEVFDEMISDYAPTRYWNRNIQGRYRFERIG